MNNEEQIFMNLLKLLDESTCDLESLNKQIEIVIANIKDGKVVPTLDLCEVIFKSIPIILSSNSNVLNLLISAVNFVEKRQIQKKQ